MREGTASRTARSVAAHRLDYDRLRTPYGDPAADEALARDVAAGLERPPGTRMHAYLRARTAFFDRVVVNSVEAGVRQVVTGAAGLPLWALLSRALLAFATEFEDESGRSLAISANLLRVLTEDGVRRRDVPALAGVSRESVAMAMGPATGNGLVADEPDPAGSRSRVIRLTAAGARAQRAYYELAGGIEDRWRDRFGASRAAALRAALERLAVGDPPPLFAGLIPYPDGWRARVRPPSVLPHYPMTLHRGGYPDGS